MPVLVFSDSLSGKLTRPSMLLAFAVLLVGAGLLAWRIRELFAAGRPWSRFDAVVAGGSVFVIGCGTTALVLASRANVYNEAICWGAAWALLAYERLIAAISARRGVASPPRPPSRCCASCRGSRSASASSSHSVCSEWSSRPGRAAAQSRDETDDAEPPSGFLADTGVHVVPSVRWGIESFAAARFRSSPTRG